MGDNYDVKLCDERHGKIVTEFSDLWRQNGELIKAVNGKFNKIMFAIMITLLSVVGSLITIIATRH